MAAREKRSWWKVSPGFLVGLIIFAAVILLGAMYPMPSESPEHPLDKALSNAKQLGLGCSIYANDHNGKFPEKLHDLVPDYIPDGQIFQFTNPFDKSIHKWIYFSGQSKDAPPKFILIASPSVDLTTKTKRIVVHVDSSGEIIPEDAFQRAIKAQRQSSPAAKPQPAPAKQ